MKKKFYLFFPLLLFTIFSCFADAEKKVALLFLTRSDLNQPQIWKEWVDRDKFNVYNHTKFPVHDPWLAQFWIGQCHPTEWGFTLFAQQALLREALQNPSNYKFVFLSESCVPLRTSYEVHHILTSDNSSYMRWYNIWWIGNPNRTLSEFPTEHHWGNHTWIILNRNHAQMIVDDNHWLPLAMRHLCCDEAYPSTFFSMHGVLHEFKNELTTCVDWNRGAPYVFTDHTEENLSFLIDAKYNTHGHFGPRHCLFARKFSKEFPVDIIQYIIQFGTQKTELRKNRSSRGGGGKTKKHRLK